MEFLDPDRGADTSLLGSLAHFSTLLSDYEHVTHRGCYVDRPGGRSYLPGQDRGKGYWFGLGNYLFHYLFGAYEDFDGEDRQDANAVQFITLHQAKGLEWPIVFLPSLVEWRIPTYKIGHDYESLFSGRVFLLGKRELYAGTDGDARRFFILV
jgi:DNA helicase II / ATP-dependent DNA helicase PcrA